MRTTQDCQKGSTLRNLLRHRLLQGQQTFGLSIGIGSPEVPYALGNAGLDWLNFDLQHTVLDTHLAAKMIQAMSYSQTVPLVRVSSNDLGMINKALDIGAQAIIVPMVNSGEDAEKAVQSSRYPPKGIRSWGQRPALRDPEYAATANSEIMIIPQIETQLALRNLEDIVSTEGIEAVFCGPYDLSMSLGVFRQFDDPRFLKAIDLIVSTCKARNVAPGLLAPVGPVERAIERGFRLIALGSDISMLADSVAKALGNARRTVGTVAPI